MPPAGRPPPPRTAEPPRGAEQIPPSLPVPRWERMETDFRTPTRQPYSLCRAQVGKEGRQGLWEGKSRSRTTTSGSRRGGRKRCGEGSWGLGCDVNATRIGGGARRRGGGGTGASLSIFLQSVLNNGGTEPGQERRRSAAFRVHSFTQSTFIESIRYCAWRKVPGMTETTTKERIFQVENAHGNAIRRK